MALELGNVVGKVGGGGDVIRDPLGGKYSGAAFSTLRTITVSNPSFVAAHVEHPQPGTVGNYGDPTPVIRITSGSTVISTMTPSVSRTNYYQPMRVTAVVGPGTYQIEFTAATSRIITLQNLIISIVPV